MRQCIELSTHGRLAFMHTAVEYIPHYIGDVLLSLILDITAYLPYPIMPVQQLSFRFLHQQHNSRTRLVRTPISLIVLASLSLRIDPISLSMAIWLHVTVSLLEFGTYIRERPL